MRKTICVVLAAALCLSVPVMAQHEGHDQDKTQEAPWFDMEHCDFCKSLIKDPALLDHMTWEHHDIASGIVSITTVDPKFRASYDEAQGAMMKLGADLESGAVKMTDLKLCGSCMAYGGLEQAGAKIEYIMGKGADVMIMTSDSPETIKMIHEYGQRNRDELAIWEEARKAPK